MPPKKRDVPSGRVRIDGYQQMPIINEREQRFWDWYQEMKKNRKAFPMAKALIIAALHGEMGARVQEAIVTGDTEQAQEALDDLLGNFLS
jgi:hypothetical protein